MEGFAALPDEAPKKVSLPQSELDPPSRASGKGPERLKKSTNRRAAIYFPRSKGNGSKPGMQESSCGSRTSLPSRPVLTHPPGQGGPGTGRTPIGADLVRC